ERPDHVHEQRAIRETCAQPAQCQPRAAVARHAAERTADGNPEIGHVVLLPARNSPAIVSKTRAGYSANEASRPRTTTNGGAAMTDDSVTRRSVLKAAAAGAVLVGTNAGAQQLEDLTKLTIEEAGKRIAAKNLSPVDLTRAYLDRIARLDKRINA